ncbi:MAG: ABC transporter substrate-binding protein [Actinomycetaceae bacterium]|nr:ABC transporter substrate-binding protein [Arcanobacterium sp.]MDD7687714.1 ABC transporter substrate-binding protein [Actinomycetaceae bacterium]MDY5274237.1 ABC transporter substrate-binding protein [Arcanobacterium sp.]
MRKKLAAIAVLAMAASVLTACSSGHSGAAPSADAAQFEGRGAITYVQGKDNAGKVQGLLDKWNANHPDEQVTLIELSTEADQQRQSMIQNAQTKSDAYCTESVDNVWVAEFAANQWIMPLPEDQLPKDKFLEPVWNTGLYRGHLFAVPHASDGALLYYRSDLLKQAGYDHAPATWDEMKQMCTAVKALPGQENINCYAGQFAKYEGLTVNFDEAVHTAGGQIVDPDTGKVAVDSPQARKGLELLSSWVREGLIPKEALNYKEEDSRNAFQSGKLVFLRNWPYVYSLAKQQATDIHFDVAPIPGLAADSVGASSLGGHDIAISTFCKNKATALDFVKFYTSAEAQTYMLQNESLAPVYTELYENADNVAQFPYLPTLKKSIEAAYPRPQVVNYGDVTAAIQDAVFPTLLGESDVDGAIATLTSKLSSLIAN